MYSVVDELWNVPSVYRRILVWMLWKDSQVFPRVRGEKMLKEMERMLKDEDAVGCLNSICSTWLVELIIGIPKSYVEGGIGKFFQSNAEMIGTLMGW